MVLPCVAAAPASAEHRETTCVQQLVSTPASHLIAKACEALRIVLAVRHLHAVLQIITQARMTDDPTSLTQDSAPQRLQQRPHFVLRLRRPRQHHDRLARRDGVGASEHRASQIGDACRAVQLISTSFTDRPRRVMLRDFEFLWGRRPGSRTPGTPGRRCLQGTAIGQRTHCTSFAAST